MSEPSIANRSFDVRDPYVRVSFTKQQAHSIAISGFIAVFSLLIIVWIGYSYLNIFTEDHFRLLQDVLVYALIAMPTVCLSLGLLLEMPFLLLPYIVVTVLGTATTSSLTIFIALAAVFPSVDGLYPWLSEGETIWIKMFCSLASLVLFCFGAAVVFVLLKSFFHLRQKQPSLTEEYRPIGNEVYQIL